MFGLTLILRSCKKFIKLNQNIQIKKKTQISASTKKCTKFTQVYKTLFTHPYVIVCILVYSLLILVLCFPFNHRQTYMNYSRYYIKDYLKLLSDENFSFDRKTLL